MLGQEFNSSPEESGTTRRIARRGPPYHDTPDKLLSLRSSKFYSHVSLPRFFFSKIEKFHELWDLPGITLKIVYPLFLANLPGYLGLTDSNQLAVILLSRVGYLTTNP